MSIDITDIIEYKFKVVLDNEKPAALKTLFDEFNKSVNNNNQYELCQKIFQKKILEPQFVSIDDDCYKYIMLMTNDKEKNLFEKIENQMKYVKELAICNYLYVQKPLALAPAPPPAPPPGPGTGPVPPK
jgi:hypothetical protein